MKFSLIAAVVLLALAQGSFAQDVANLEGLGQFFEKMKNKMTLDLTEIVHNQDLANQAQTFVEDRKTQLEPVAAQMQEQLKTVLTNFDEQVKPMMENIRKQLEDMFQKLTEPAKATDN